MVVINHENKYALTTIAQTSFLMNNQQRRGSNSERESYKAYSYLTKRQRVLLSLVMNKTAGGLTQA